MANKAISSNDIKLNRSQIQVLNFIEYNWHLEEEYNPERQTYSRVVERNLNANCD